MNSEMREEYSTLEMQLLTNIRESFNYHLIANATFLAEKLLAERDNAETRLILAECYFAEAKHNMVFNVLTNVNTPAARYLSALAAIKLNKTDQAEAILQKDLNPASFNQSVMANPYSLYLIGEAYERAGKEAEAVNYYKKAFDLNPCLWVAFEKLCKLSYIEPNNIQTMFRDNPKRQSKEQDAPLALLQTLPEREVKKKNMKQDSFTEILIDQSKSQSKSNPAKKPLFGVSAVKEKEKKENSGTLVSNLIPTSGNKELTQLLLSLGSPYLDMIKFNCKKAIEGFRSLPRNHSNSGWTLVNIGRCFMDLGDNEKAEEAFIQAFKNEKHRVKGVEYYSSCLWQLKKHAELCKLAFEVIEYNQFSPEAWIALGNCYSLQRDNDSALNFFHRAIQLEPRFSYAHCLKGHEYIYCDQYVKAKNCYELALKTDQSNFHAWWGLGNVALKQEKYEKAFDYFNKASSLNSKNSVVQSYIGIVLEKMEKNSEALNAFKKSEELNPKTLMNRFHKAQIYYKMGDYSNALMELEKLINLSPKESQVYVMIGNVYKRLGNPEKALQYYQSAQDLESKESQRVKNLIDALTHNKQFNNYDTEFVN